MQWRRLSLFLGGPLAAGLVVFHVDLFWDRIRDRSILEPLILVQWLFAALLVGVMWHLHRRQVSLFRGRRALAFWLMVLLLHVMAPEAVEWIDDHSALLLAIPVAPIVLMLFRSAFGLLRRSPRPASPVSVWRRRHPLGRAPTDPGHPRALFARPPPSFESIVSV